MSNKQQYRGAVVADFIPADQLAKIKEFAMEPRTLKDKLALFDKYATEHEVPNPNNTKRKDRRSRLGSFVNKMFNSQLVLPQVGRRQQIGKAIKFAKTYLIEHPEVSVYYATGMGAAIEYREWMDLVGDLNPEQQLSIMNSELTE
jgi:hypothetical protein